MVTIDELRALAREIREERQIGGNTGARVGNTFDKVADLLESTGGDISDIREAVEQLLQDVGFIPRDVSRTATDAVFTNSEGELLFWLRAATDTLAGLITAANNNKLIALPTAEELAQALAAKQNRLTFDQQPIEGSTNPVTSDGINTAIANFVTRSVSNLIYYYTKSETYTKEEVDALVAAIKQFVPVVAQTLPTASADTMYKLYLIPSDDPQADNVKDEYITIDNGAGANPRYTWEKIGSTDIDLSPYYIKPEGGIPKSDLAEDVQTSLGKADTAFQKPSGGIPLSDIDPSDIDNVPTAGSSKLVKSGGVQNELALGAVYDVSAKNPTAGPNNDGKFTIEYILNQNNVNTLIPSAVRKGGMSIKFVQSSDNKYVQYRLMSNTFNTTPTNWQGVDNEPTDGSDNLVKSGGVHNANNDQLFQEFGKQSLSITNLTVGYQFFILQKNLKLGEYVVKVTTSSDAHIERIGFATGTSTSVIVDYEYLIDDNFYANKPRYIPISITNIHQIYLMLRPTTSYEGTLSVEIVEKHYASTNIEKIYKDYNNLFMDSNALVQDTTKTLEGNYESETINLSKALVANNKYLLEVSFDSPNYISTFGGSDDVQTFLNNKLIGQDKQYYEIIPTTSFSKFKLRVLNTGTIHIRLIDLQLLEKTASNLSEVMQNQESIQNQLGIDYEDKFSSITWNNGRLRPTGTIYDESTGYQYSNPFAVKKGDVIDVTMASFLNADYGAVFESDQSATYRYIKKVGGSLNYRYIVERDCYLVICVRKLSTTVGHWWSAKSNDYSLSSLTEKSIYRDEIILPLLANAHDKDSHGQGYFEQPVSLLHFSDVHSVITNMDNIITFLNRYKRYIDDAICTGDMAGSTYQDYSALWQTDDYKNILQVIGNHDVYNGTGTAPSTSYDDPAYWATAAQKYQQYIAPHVSNWAVTQPTDAALNGYCYYYKDYAASKLRLIVLDAMAFDATQLAWLAATLESARTNAYGVVIADHFEPIDYYADIAPFDTPFHSLMTGMERAYSSRYLPGAADAVDTFINNGGEFICWLCGHMHYDQVGTSVSHPNQIFIAIGAAMPNPTWQDCARELGSNTYDLFNIISFDTHRKIIKVARIGAEWDRWLRHRGTMTIDYANKKLLSSF